MDICIKISNVKKEVMLLTNMRIKLIQSYKDFIKRCIQLYLVEAQSLNLGKCTTNLRCRRKDTKKVYTIVDDESWGLLYSDIVLSPENYELLCKYKCGVLPVNACPSSYWCGTEMTNNPFWTSSVIQGFRPIFPAFQKLGAGKIGLGLAL